MGSSGEGTDNAFTEIRYGRCERNTIEGNARGGRAACDRGRTRVEESPGDILAGNHGIRRIGGELRDREHRPRVTVDDGGSGEGDHKCKEGKHSQRRT